MKLEALPVLAERQPRVFDDEIVKISSNVVKYFCEVYLPSVGVATSLQWFNKYFHTFNHLSKALWIVFALLLGAQIILTWLFAKKSALFICCYVLSAALSAIGSLGSIYQGFDNEATDAQHHAVIWLFGFVLGTNSVYFVDTDPWILTAYNLWV
uniref:Glycerophosphocholine acyltransferase 1 n=1 Tax=Panagrellus redivivus TaxID=6233 RepID=A0A7E5A212_PANRE